MESHLYQTCARASDSPDGWLMDPVISPVDSSAAADVPIVEEPRPAAALRPVRNAKVVKHLTMMKALASRARLTAIELCLDGSAFTATALEAPLRMSARRVADHMKILCRIGVLQRRTGKDRREVEYVIHPGFVRRADDGTAIFDFGSGQLHFPHVRLPE